jgi:hypothetical protein
VKQIWSLAEMSDFGAMVACNQATLHMLANNPESTRQLEFHKSRNHQHFAAVGLKSQNLGQDCFSFLRFEKKRFYTS